MSNTPLQSAQCILSIFVSTQGARPGRSFAVSLGKPITETHTVATDGTVTVGNAAAFAWDGGVNYLKGNPLAAVSSSPSRGQYGVRAGVYALDPADAFAKVSITYRFVSTAQLQFPGALQAAFLQNGFALGDLINGLAYAVAEGWLSTVSAPTDDFQTYVLEQPGFTEAGGAAPSLAASAQRAINTIAALNGKPGAARFDAKGLVASFVGTVGGNTFAPEDLLPGCHQAVANGWLRPVSPFEPVFLLTAAGAAQAT
jgi:hypothetical protein